MNLTALGVNDIVYDIGGGKGIITSALADRCRAVISVKIDPHVAAKLRANMKGRSNGAVYLADFLDFPLPGSPYKVFANIPFNLARLLCASWLKPGARQTWPIW